MIYACFGITCRSWSCICAAVWGNFGIKFLKSSNKIYKKRNVYVFLYMFYRNTSILCECVCVPQKWVKLAQMLQLFACSTLKHFYLPRLQQVFAAQTHTITYVYTHLHLHTHAYTFLYTHISHTHTCPASPCLVFRLSILHMHLCWHYYNTRPTLPPIPPLFSVFPSSNLQLCIEVASFGWSLPRCMQWQRQRQRKRKLLFCSAIGKSENCKTKIVPLFILLSLSYISFRFSLLPAYKALANN